jgi:threonine/homoserine/homoserine lactone efflux protein
MASFFVAGVGFGVAIAATPGPMAFLCIRRTLDRGFRSGLASGLGVATADAVYAGIAAFAIAAVVRFVAADARQLAFAGGLGMVIVGAGMALSRSDRQSAARETSARLGRVYVSSLALTLANPPTVLSFAALAAGVRVGGGVPAGLVVAGVLVGSASWWIVLAAAVNATRRGIGRLTRPLSVAAGGAIALFGLAAMASSLRP